jgi:hypothetical protein
MFNRILAPANPEIVKNLLVWSGISVAGEGAASVGALVTKLNELLPKEMILANFTYMSLAIGFVTALPLVAFPRVISVACAQLGLATSLVYLGYSATGAFQPDFTFVINSILVILAVVFLIIFSGGSIDLARNRCWSDFIVSIFVMLIFLMIWLFPLYRTWIGDANG